MHTIPLIYIYSIPCDVCFNAFFYHFGYKKTANYLGIPIFFGVFFDFRLDPVEDEPVLEWFYDPVSWPSHDLGSSQKPRFWRVRKYPGSGSGRMTVFFFFCEVFFWCWILWKFFFWEANSDVVPLYVVCWKRNFPCTFFGHLDRLWFQFIVMYIKNWNQAWNYIFFYRHIISLKQWSQVIPKKSTSANSEWTALGPASGAFVEFQAREWHQLP